MQVNDFRHGNHCKVLIASYETLRKHCTAMAGMIDLLVCDEGHRLKVCAPADRSAHMACQYCQQQHKRQASSVLDKSAFIYGKTD